MSCARVNAGCHEQQPQIQTTLQCSIICKCHGIRDPAGLMVTLLSSCWQSRTKYIRMVGFDGSMHSPLGPLFPTRAAMATGPATPVRFSLPSPCTATTNAWRQWPHKASAALLCPMPKFRNSSLGIHWWDAYAQIRDRRNGLFIKHVNRDVPSRPDTF